MKAEEPKAETGSDGWPCLACRDISVIFFFIEEDIFVTYFLIKNIGSKEIIRWLILLYMERYDPYLLCGELSYQDRLNF